jgi:hypothetical protein
MNYYTIGDSRTILFTLKRNGKLRDYSLASSISASFINFKYGRLRSQIVQSVNNSDGSNWAASLAAFNFSTASTAGIQNDEVLKVRIKVIIGAELLTFYSEADYKFISDAV